MRFRLGPVLVTAAWSRSGLEAGPLELLAGQLPWLAGDPVPRDLVEELVQVRLAGRATDQWPRTAVAMVALSAVVSQSRIERGPDARTVPVVAPSGPDVVQVSCVRSPPSRP